MDDAALRFDWSRARAFLATAEAGSFSGAARALGLAQPTVGRQVAALEAELGVALFERVGQGVALTEAGLELVEPLRAMAEAASDVGLAASGAAGRIEGLVRVTASEMIAAHLLPPVIARLRAEHPGIHLEIVATQEVRDLRRREADLAIRNTAPTDPELVARRLPTAEGGLYASPAYLERLGPLAGPADLARADFLTFDTGPSMANFLRAMGVPIGPERFRLASASHLVQWALCRAGLGVAVNMRVIAEADPGVRRVPVDLPPIPVPMWLVSHRALRTSRRLRVVAEALAAELGG
jgi:DNA-binding transcriptional LysR family regulator